MKIRITSTGGLAPDMVVAEIERLKPDVLVLEELVPRLFSAVKAALDKFKYSNYVLRPDPYGIGIFSHLPMTNKSTHPLDLVIPLVTQSRYYSGQNQRCCIWCAHAYAACAAKL